MISNTVKTREIDTALSLVPTDPMPGRCGERLLAGKG
jgi:hypothetical protein